MRLCRREFLHLSAAAPALALVSSSARAQAQEFPARPVRIITHSAPGGSPDALLRIVADRLSQMWGRQVLALNHPGAGGAVELQAVANSTITAQPARVIGVMRMKLLPIACGRVCDRKLFTTKAQRAQKN